MKFYGHDELVAEVSGGRQINAAVEVGRQWNQFGAVPPFSLYTPARPPSFTGAADRAELDAIGHLHSGAVGSALLQHSDHCLE